MAVSVTRRSVPNLHQASGGLKRTVSNVALDSSYLEGGETLTAADLGLNRVEHATCTLYTTQTTTVNIAQASYDPSTSLLHVWDNTPAEVAGSANVSGAVIQVLAYGQ